MKSFVTVSIDKRGITHRSLVLVSALIGLIYLKILSYNCDFIFGSICLCTETKWFSEDALSVSCQC